MATEILWVSEDLRPVIFQGCRPATPVRHVHDYQRFSRKQGKVSIPYIINGNAGCANNAKLLHKLQPGISQAPLPFPTPDQRGVSLEAFEDENSGFLRVTASPTALTVEYFAVPFDSDPNINNHADAVTVTPSTAKSL